MAITITDLFEDPAYFLYEIDDKAAQFVPMTSDSFHRSIFLDGRIRKAAGNPFSVQLEQLARAHEHSAGANARIGWIFHVAQCGSTLIARALDHPGRSLVLREPAALRRIGLRADGNGQLDARQSELLAIVCRLLAKRWDADSPLLIKANVPVNAIAPELMQRDPDAPALVLYFPLRSYVAAILRTPGHVEWTKRVFAELRLDQSGWCASATPESVAQKAAALWFFQMKAFETLLARFPNCYSLHAAEIFDNALECVVSSAELFGVDLERDEAQRIVNGELYHSYSKNPALDYDPEVRIAREQEALDRLAPEIADACEWGRDAADRHALVARFDRPLVGRAPELLS